MIQPLESRLHLHAGHDHAGTLPVAPPVTIITVPHVELKEGVLTVLGDNRDNHITFERTANRTLTIKFDEHGWVFKASAVKRIFAAGGDGDDTINLGPKNIRAHFHGGRGDDTLTGGNLDDTLNGGHGHDRLSGNYGQDTLWGGARDGNDILNGGPGADLLDGGDGRDLVRFTSGPDVTRHVEGIDAPRRKTLPVELRPDQVGVSIIRDGRRFRARITVLLPAGDHVQFGTLTRGNGESFLHLGASTSIVGPNQGRYAAIARPVRHYVDLPGGGPGTRRFTLLQRSGVIKTVTYEIPPIVFTFEPATLHPGQITDLTTRQVHDGVEATLRFVHGPQHDPRFGTPERNGRNIVLNVDYYQNTTEGIAFPAVVLETDHTFHLGELDPGQYTLTVQSFNKDVKTLTFHLR
jgi:hypothetical protein